MVDVRIGLVFAAPNVTFEIGRILSDNEGTLDTSGGATNDKIGSDCNGEEKFSLSDKLRPWAVEVWDNVSVLPANREFTQLQHSFRWKKRFN